MLRKGETYDSAFAVDLLLDIDIFDSNILADKAYGTAEIHEYIESQNSKYTIPPKSNSVNLWYRDFWIYKKRHLIECFFNKLKAFRRVATQYDKLATSFLAFIYITSISILFK